jgi:hypothetical protein
MPFDDTAVNSVGSIAPLSNVILFSELIERVMSRSAGLPGLATFHGPSGYGKSRAATWGANRYRAYYVQVKSLWTRKSMCQAVLKEMGVAKPAPTMADMLDQMAEQLVLSKRPLLFDEADYLCTKGMIELVRDIYEASNAPIILIGEEGLPTKLKAWERVHGRMLDWVAAQPASIDDTRELARLYAKGVSVAEDLLKALFDASAGSTRRVCVNLDRVREAAQTADVRAIDLAQWRELSGEFFTGAVPGVRRGL